MQSASVLVRESTPRRGSSRFGLALLGIVLIVGLTYALAWNRAYTLTQRFLAEAQQSYAEGRYLEALTGYESFDPHRRHNVYHGGYFQIEAIWRDPYAWPRYGGLGEVRARIEEVIQHKLSLEEAERFIEAQTGQHNPYLGAVYVRLGQLYAESGDKVSARELLLQVPELFPEDPALIERAKAYLETLGP